AAVGILPINGFELGEAEVEGYAFLLTAVASLMLPSAIICFLGPIKRTMTLYLTVFLSIACMGALLIFTLLSREVSLFASALPLGAYFVITLHLDNNIPPSGRDEFKILFAFSV